MHPGKCSFCWARRRCLTREARSTWVEVLQTLTYSGLPRRTVLLSYSAQECNSCEDLGPVEGVGSQG